jgi:hypothetical protein
VVFAKIIGGDTMHYFHQFLLGSVLAAGYGLGTTAAWALPTTGCIQLATDPVAETCTLVEATEPGEAGGSETESAESVFNFIRTGYVPIFESSSGAGNSAFPSNTNPPGVVGAVSDYVFITPLPGDFG